MDAPHDLVGPRLRPHADDPPGRSRPGRRYLLVSPCRDEAAYMRRTLESVARQSVHPALWVVVDDGSTDATPAILAEYARRLPWLAVVRRPDRGRRQVGPGVIEAFEEGCRAVDLSDFDFLCKLDLDLDLPARYFERLMALMEADPRLGTVSGKSYVAVDGRTPRREPGGDEVSAGMTKFYRVECFREIGGFVREVMWDGIDCHRCRMLGWKARSLDEPELRFLHLRPMGSSQKGLWTGRWRHGAGQWFMGTGPLYMSASALYRCTQPPRLWGGLAMWLGYVASALRRRPRYPDLEFRARLHRFQRDALWLGKARALERAEGRCTGAPRVALR
jgi:biofilm PGA synthesis N-glycosyltransferase PgaC